MMRKFTMVCGWMPPVPEYRKHCFSLRDAMEKIFQDGFDALSEAQNAEADFGLKFCRACVERDFDDVHCLNADGYKEEVDWNEYGALQPSTDIAVPIYGDAAQIGLLLVEAKLGERSSTDSRPRHPGKEELFDKFKYTVERLNRFAKINNSLYFLVPKSSYQWQCYRASRWNKGSRPCDIVVRCCNQFLEEVGVPDKSNSLVCENQSYPFARCLRNVRDFGTTK